LGVGNVVLSGRVAVVRVVVWGSHHGSQVHPDIEGPGRAFSEL
jgi:hypothetical protein